MTAYKMTAKERRDAKAIGKQMNCIWLLERIAIELANMPANSWSDCEYGDLYRQLSDIEDRVCRKGEYAPENVAPTGRR